MMNCRETENNIDSYLDGELLFAEQKALELHLSSCVNCEQQLDEIKNLRQALGMLPMLEPSAGFEEKVFEAVRNQYPLHASNRFIIGFVSTMVASFAIWFFSSAIFSQFNAQQPQMINLAMNQNHTVRLMLDAPTDIEQVTLSLGLPENIRLKGYESKQQLVWKTRLSKGSNILSLPVTAITKGEGDLVAQVEYGNRVKKFHIIFKTMNDSLRVNDSSTQLINSHSIYSI